MGKMRPGGLSLFLHKTAPGSGWPGRTGGLSLPLCPNNGLGPENDGNDTSGCLEKGVVFRGKYGRHA